MVDYYTTISVIFFLFSRLGRDLHSPTVIMLQDTAGTALQSFRNSLFFVLAIITRVIYHSWFLYLVNFVNGTTA